ncbi:MAG: flagellar filament capping protein FliD [Solirubrobacteraceae bacterium]|nr:flagellar filament capping protein FliD [Solirubrobacteraceae bacterium]
MAGIALNGISSGMDTGTMISQLMAIEKQSRTPMEYRQVNAQARTDSLSSVSTKLNALKLAAQDLKSVSLWNPQQSVDVSDTTKISASRTGGAGTGATSIEVLGLASSSQRTFSYTSPAADETWTFGGATVNMTAGMTLDEAVLAINGQPDTGVIAVNAGGKLVVSSTTTGAGSQFAWSAGSMVQDTQKDGVDAQFKVDGGSVQTSATNVVSSAVPGVDITLKAITSSPVSVTVGSPTADKASVATKLKAFVSAYNDVVETVTSLTGEKKVTSPASAADAKKGSLYADGGLRSLQSSLRNAVNGAVSGLGATMDQLSELGISTGAASATINQDALKGKLVFDETKFNTAMAADPTGVRKLLGGVTGTNGIAQRFDELITPYTQAGGILANRKTEVDSELKRIKDSLTTFDDRLVMKETRLRKQFQTMETLLARQNAHGSALSSAISGLSNS